MAEDDKLASLPELISVTLSSLEDFPPDLCLPIRGNTFFDSTSLKVVEPKTIYLSTRRTQRTEILVTFSVEDLLLVI